MLNKPKYQSHQEIIINAPIKFVWDFNQDLSNISLYHPRVTKVSLVSNKQFREPGVEYQCHLNDGKNTCNERDIEIVEMQKIVTIMPTDTMGISRILPDYLVESIFTSLDDNNTKLEFFHFYSTSTLKAKLVNLVAKPKIAKKSNATLQAMKKAIEVYFVN